MSTTIDNKVVEMQFDNSNFETNVKTSLNTLDKLKQSLNMDSASQSFSQLDSAANSVSFDSLVSSVESLESRFSTMGIVAMEVITKITDAILNKLSSAISSVFSSIVSGGITRALNLEKAEFMLDGLLDTEEEVELVMENVNAAVDGTAYSLDSAAMVASQLVASGIEAGDEMESILSGIAGVAAMTDSTYSDIGSIFTTVAGNGRLMTEQLNQFSYRGLNAAATLAEYLGVTEAEVREMTSDGEISFEIFANAMTEAFGDQAKKANETFSGATSNISAALARIGALFVSPLVERNGSIVDLLNTTRERINDIKTLIEPFATTVTDAIISLADKVNDVVGNLDLDTPFESFYNIVTIVTNAGKLLWQIISTIGEAFKEVFPDSLASELSSITEGIANLTENFKMNDSQLSKLKSVFKGFFSVVDLVYQGIKSLITTVFPLTSIFGYVGDAVLSVAGTIGDFIVVIHDAIEEAGVISGVAEGISEVISDITSRIANLAQTITEKLNLTDASDALEGFFSSVDSEGTSGLSKISSALSAIAEFFNSILSAFGKADLSGMASAVKKLGEAAKISFSAFGDAVANLVKEIAEVIPAFGEVAASVISTLASLVDDVGDLVRKIITEAAKTVVQCAPVIGQAITSLITTAASVIVSCAPVIANAALEVVLSVIEALASYAPRIIDALIDLVNAVVDAVIDRISSSSIGSAFLNILTVIKNAVSEIISTIKNFVSNVASALGIESFQDLIGDVESVGIVYFLTQIGDALKNFSSNVKQLTSIESINKSITSIFTSNDKKSTTAINSLLKVAAAILILAVALNKISAIDSDKITQSLAAMLSMFIELAGEMVVLSKFTSKTSGINTTLIAIAAAMVILASAMTKLAALDWNGIAKGLVGIGAMMAELYVFIFALSKLKVSNLTSTAAGLVILAAALKLMASACGTFAGMSWDEVAKGLTGVGVLLAEVIGFMVLLKYTDSSGSSMIATAAGIVILAAGLKVMASACSTFGSMDISSLVKGLSSIAIVLAEVVAFDKLTGETSLISTAAGLIIISAAMNVMADAVEAFGSMDISTLAKSLSAMAIVIAEVVVAMKVMPSGKEMLSAGAGLLVVGVALEAVAEAVISFGSMSLGEMAKGLVALGVAMLELAFGLNAMEGTISGAAALLVASAGLTVLVPVLTSLGSLTWSSIVKSLVAIAGAFTVLGVAATVLGPLVPTIVSLSAALVAFGVAVAAVGVGVAALGVGLNLLNTAFITLAAAGVSVVIAAVEMVKLLLVGIVDIVEELIVGICEAIANSATSIAKAVKALIVAVCDIIVECVPTIVNTVLEIVIQLLDALVSYIPQIVNYIFDFLISILDTLAERMPELITAIVNVLKSVFSGVIDAIGEIDVETLISAIAGIGLMAGVMAALSAVAGLIPGAMVGVLGIGAIIAELALVLAAIGALAQIPGLEWLINEGGDLLQSIGTAIGQFVGGIVGGFASGVSSQFPQIGADLSAFMTNAEPFIEGASNISSDMLDGVKALAEVILLLTAADILSALTSWLTGGSSLSDFAEDLVPFGTAMKEFASEVEGIDSEVVTAAANAGATIAELASSLPNSGGVVGWFMGENDMGEFAEQLVPFGTAIKDFSDAVVGVDADVVENAALAGTALAELASTLPNSGGVVGWFMGENDMDEFASQITPFGTAIKDFSDATQGVDPDTVTAAASAGKAVAELADSLPNSGGVVEWFTGSNDMSDFATQLPLFGIAIKAFSVAVQGVNAASSVNAAMVGATIANLIDSLPSDDGVIGDVVGWFTGDNNDMEGFVDQFGMFGTAIKAFSNATEGINADTVTAAATAGASIAELANSLPESGGIKEWFTGSVDMSAFADQLEPFGEGIKAFSDAVIGLDQEAVQNAATAGNSIAELTEAWPHNVDMSTFGDQLDLFALAIASFAEQIAGINVESMASSTTSISDSISTMLTTVTDKISNSSSTFKSSGESLMTSFKSGMTSQTDSIKSSFTTVIESCSTAVKNKYGTFTTLGEMLVSKIISGVKSNSESAKSAFVTIITNSLTAIKNKYSEFNTIGSITMTKFIAGVKTKSDASKTAYVNIIANCLTAIKNKYSEFTSVGETTMTKFIAGVKTKDSAASTACKNIATTCVSALESYYSKFYDAGAYLVEGFADGIDDNTYLAEAKARAMAKAAAEAAEDELDEASPSKVGYGIGDYFGIGFVNGIVENVSTAYEAGSGIAASAKSGLSEAISSVVDIINNDVDAEPMIRPVLDLSDVESKTRTLNAMLSSAQASTISASLQEAADAKIQNGTSNGSNSTQFNFTQNNYSPKSLSRTEIYRQTKNQFSALKRKVVI